MWLKSSKKNFLPGSTSVYDSRHKSIKSPQEASRGRKTEEKLFYRCCRKTIHCVCVFLELIWDRDWLGCFGSACMTSDPSTPTCTDRLLPPSHTFFCSLTPSLIFQADSLNAKPTLQPVQNFAKINLFIKKLKLFYFFDRTKIKSCSVLWNNLTSRLHRP